MSKVILSCMAAVSENTALCFIGVQFKKAYREKSLCQK